MILGFLIAVGVVLAFGTGFGLLLIAFELRAQRAHRRAPKTYGATEAKTIVAGLGPATAAGKRGHELHEAFAKAYAQGAPARRPMAAPDSPVTSARPGSPDGVRELLDGMGDALLLEAASAAIRDDVDNCRTLQWLEEFVRDARDAIRG